MRNNSKIKDTNKFHKENDIRSEAVKLRNNITEGKNVREESETSSGARNNNWNKKENTKKKITVIGDSIVKNIQPHKMKNTLGDDRLYVKDMLDDSKPILRKKPDIII